MTTTSYTTTGDVPPAPWSALLADIQRVLTVLERDGTAITGPDGTGPAILDADRIAFIATAPGLPPLPVQFDRAAGTGETATSHPATTGLTLATMARAARHWGRLLTWTTDADVTARAIGTALVDALFGADDLAIAGGIPPGVPFQVGQMVAEATATVAGGTTDTLLAALDTVIGHLSAQRAGIAAAEQLLTPTAAPAKQRARRGKRVTT
jgi:hypothetical protein